MPKIIVVTVNEYDGTLADAEENFRMSEGRYEGFSYVYGAESLNDLPHPMQLPEVREHFGDTLDRTPGLR